MPEDTSPGGPRGWVDGFVRGPAVALLALLLFGMANYASARHYRRFDCTQTGQFTLSPRSQEIARRLRGQTEIYLLMGRQEPLYREVSELAARYAAVSRAVTVHTLDPDRDRERYIAFANRINLALDAADEHQRPIASCGVVVVRGARHWEIQRESLAELGAGGEGDEGGANRLRNAQITVERAFSEALLQVDDERRTKVCLSTGHNELSLGSAEHSAQGLVDALRHSRFEVEPVEVRGQRQVPRSCDVLLIAGTARPWSPEDALAVERYLRAGGNLAAFVDPLALEGRIVPTGLEGVARSVGIGLPPLLTLEQDPAHLQRDVPPMQFRVDTWNEHEITRNLRGTQLIVSMVRPLVRAEGSAVVPVVLASTTPEGWGESNVADLMRTLTPSRDAHDLAGPITVAMASSLADAPARPDGAPSGRAVFVGTSSIVENINFNPQLRAALSNASLVEASLGWLTARHEMIDIPSRPADRAAMLVPGDDLSRVTLYVVLLIPLAAALVGVAVWRARKNAT
ncbi:MAG: GldG family protein [Myxococcales bacterium]|nr:GldG family protein [Myxococcales bacterium]